MADPRVFDVPVHVAQEAALGALGELLEDVPEAQQSFAEKYGNPNLLGSPATLVEAAANDRQVREEHGQAIMDQALVLVLVHALRAQGTLGAKK
jgi:hypothetical protein